MEKVLGECGGHTHPGKGGMMRKYDLYDILKMYREQELLEQDDEDEENLQIVKKLAEDTIEEVNEVLEEKREGEKKEKFKRMVENNELPTWLVFLCDITLDREKGGER